VHELVRLQMVFLQKGGATIVAFERPLARVDAQVHRQTAFLLERFAAILALMDLR